ncbi:BMP/retinoic acid-inducible neural-specific protein 2 [Rhinatrema bivittatum]|uniref:BMP/retinoic acid-inducible neural-specific protein 2 n=1 Tax=Rhinatrema bivittatum TaxID=194408 RepID=UPI001127379A|nr:BMP/retinoic acid-inducible neural-specific protein 2 [Rhinatrema bivittatum]XP_029474186.1 BMP/retinoic acid-inducible neural-specific protein 2 [Rhinatrema bivittatum]XP_029474187.1 BMP/retinoic acid-inducible neural-specific protein 2 [Rhinatrema bivittatum]XP_029474188.1 BMP/retinoic acid-inducible neural-specific protein 2 [Rhinatrema bivittatum]
MRWQNIARCDCIQLMVLWASLAVSLHGWASASASAATSSEQHDFSSSGQPPLDWLLTDRGPFHHAQEYTDFMERYRQGFTTRYRIYREFGRWKVNNLVLERKDFFSLPLPLAPEFARNIRLLGRRPTLAQITENLIKKYGTHFLLSATLGGEESLTIFVDKRRLSRKLEASAGSTNGSTVSLETLHQLAASYFIDRESTLRRLHHIQIATTAIKVTETRSGPLGCSNYDNLDSVSSVLVGSPENKVQLLGLQVLLPEHLRERFVRAALSYISCSLEGELVCREWECWCRCSPGFPQCNCPEADVRAMEDSLLRSRDAWAAHHKEFEESEELHSLLKRLPRDCFLNTTAISQFWAMDPQLLRRYEQLEVSLGLLLKKAQRTIRRVFNLCKHCRRQPRFRLPRERSLSYWWSWIQSLLYCSESSFSGAFLEHSHSCMCPYDHVLCQGTIPCVLGEGSACAICAKDNSSRCGSCNLGYLLTSQGQCRPEVADSLEQYMELEMDLQDLELKYLLQKQDNRIEVRAIFISNDMRLGSWFDPSWRKRMLLTLKSNKYKPGLLHVMLGLSLQICLTKNSTLEPLMAIYVNPFGGSHSESWFMPVGESGYPDWERTKADASPQCQNWTLTLGNKWKSFFETVHVYLRSRIMVTDDSTNETLYYEPLELVDPSRNLGYMKINSLQVFGYSVPFESDAIRDLILQLDYPYTQGSQDSVLLQLLEIRDRVNSLSPPGKILLDLFTCLLRHRLKLASNEVGRIQASLRAFSSRLPNYVEYETSKLCS